MTQNQMTVKRDGLEVVIEELSYLQNGDAIMLPNLRGVRAAVHMGRNGCGMTFIGRDLTSEGDEIRRMTFDDEGLYIENGLVCGFLDSPEKEEIYQKGDGGYGIVKNPRAKARGVPGFLSTRDLCLLTHELKQGVCANTNARCIKQMLKRAGVWEAR